MERYIYEGSQTEIIEKKSRFIAAIASVRTKEEAAAFIEERRKQYWDASHHCSAFIIGSNPEITRCSDDKEPSGTGGRPMLEVLKKECIKDVVAGVTRYFGGTLLGTGLCQGGKRRIKLVQSHRETRRHPDPYTGRLWRGGKAAACIGEEGLSYIGSSV